MADQPGSSPQQPKKITTPDRVQRIMAKLGGAKVQVLIRTGSKKTVTIKATFSKTVKSTGTYIVFSNLSAAGAKILKVGTAIAVDVIGLKHRLYFESKIAIQKEALVAATMPAAIIMVERRGAERHTIRPDSMCFISLTPHLALSQDEHIIMPFAPPYSDLAMRFPVADISPSGLCFKTRFEDALKWLQPDHDNLEVRLNLPRQAPITTTAKVCWNRIAKSPNQEGTNVPWLLVGLQFGKLEDQQLITVKRYIRDMTIKEAI